MLIPWDFIYKNYGRNFEMKRVIASILLQAPFVYQLCYCLLFIIYLIQPVVILVLNGDEIERKNLKHWRQ